MKIADDDIKTALRKYAPKQNMDIMRSIRGDIKINQMELLDMKIMTPKMKISLERINNILGSAKERTCELEYIAIKTTQNKAHGGKKRPEEKKYTQHL